jgi:hypothetical protein
MICFQRLNLPEAVDATLFRRPFEYPRRHLELRFYILIQAAMMKPMMKVLVDRNIERNALTHNTVVVQKARRWGRQQVTNSELKRVARPPRPDEQFRIDQMPYLAGVCIFAKKGTVEFFTSQELRMEQFRQKSSAEGYLGVNLLDGVPMKSVRCPIERPLTISPGESVGVTEKEQMNFFSTITNLRFAQIAKAVGPTRIDAFHLWTAEEAGLDAFLTTDKKFWKSVADQREAIDSDVQVMTPRDLSEQLGLQSVEIATYAGSLKPYA